MLAPGSFGTAARASVSAARIASIVMKCRAITRPAWSAHGLCGPPRFDVVRPDRSGSRAEVLIAVSRIPARGAAGRKVTVGEWFFCCVSP
ncbi:hypothetical protein [Streptomyces sp. NPDC005498]|uniref:hypothetical protein n=1 Tax=Streptomyces sp. NPDC005498 TaxID=3364717 RepID=UPI0036880335